LARWIRIGEISAWFREGYENEGKERRNGRRNGEMARTEGG